MTYTGNRNLKESIHRREMPVAVQTVAERCERPDADVSGTLC